MSSILDDLGDLAEKAEKLAPYATAASAIAGLMTLLVKKWVSGVSPDEITDEEIAAREAANEALHHEAVSKLLSDPSQAEV